MRRSFGVAVVLLAALLMTTSVMPSLAVPVLAADPSTSPTPPSVPESGSPAPPSPEPGASPPVFATPPSLAIPPDSTLGSDAALVPPDLPPVDAIDLGADWHRSRALVAAVPTQDWRTTTLADALNDDPLSAFAWVRDSIGFDPYAGELRGAAGALAARSGNSLDRALLLQHLLGLMNVSTRLVRGTLDDAAAAALVQRAFVRPAKPLSAVALDDAETGSLDTLATRAHRDYALLRKALGERVSSMDGSSAAEAVAATRDHYWVQMAYGAEWLDLDTSMPDAQPGQTLTSVKDVLTDVPQDQVQTVTVRVLADMLSDGTLSRAPVLEQTLNAADVSGAEVYLTFAPAVTSLGGTINAALGSAVSWEPVLVVGSKNNVGTPFPITPGSDLFSGTAADGPQVARLILETVVNGPGSDPETRDSVILDRVPAALQGSTTIDPTQLQPLNNVKGIPVDFVALHHIMVSTGGFDARNHELLRTLAARVAVLEVTQPDSIQPLGFPFNAIRATVADEALVLASEDFIRTGLDADPDIRAFVARPRVYVDSVGPGDSENQLWIRADLMADGVEVLTSGSATPADAAERQIWYGVLQTALETQLISKRASEVLVGPSTQIGTSMSMDQPLTVVDAASASSLASTASPQLLTDLENGLIAVVPGDPDSASVWWTIDPADGTTRSEIAPGYGGRVARGTVPHPQPRDTGYQEPWNYTNGTPNNGPRYVIDDFDPDSPPMTRAEIDAELAEIEAEYDAANAPPPEADPECGGSEYSMTLCIAIAGAMAFAFLGIIVYIIV